MSNPYLPPVSMQTSPQTPRPVWPWIVGIVAALFFGMVIGSAVVGSASKNASSKPASTVTATSSTVTVERPPVTQTTTAQPAAPDPVVAETTQSGPKTAFSDGTYLVGTDIQPGSYKSGGPDAGGVGQCYWARLKDDSGSNIIANNIGGGPSRFTAKKGEYVQITGCSFTKI